MQNIYTKTIKVADKEIKLEVGKFSEQADAAVLATCGETVVHVTLAVGRPSNLGYFPLSVEYAEKLYAGGRIKGSRWVKREGRPTDESILKGRVIDQVQVIATVLSVDLVNDADMVALVAACAATQISSVPFDGPVAGLRIGYVPESDSFLLNPTFEERATSSLDLILCGNADAIIMVEAGANEVSEEVMIRAFDEGQKVLSDMAAQIKEMGDEIGKAKFAFVPEPEQVELQNALGKQYMDKIREMVQLEATLKPIGLDQLVAEIVASNEEYKDRESDVKHAFYNLMKAEGRRQILEDKIRPDGRKLDEIRPITCEVDLIPRVHGSAMFKRGATQALTITTLGSPAMAQLIEDAEGEETRHYIHHYNMPPYASGEAGRFGAPKRREIGHGALAERALWPMIPSQEEFPYTIQVVSEIMSSNGSTSQASVCGSTMSLMAAGVPIKRPVAGIAMGLMSDGKGTYAILSDIQGLEDHVGDMDFKVAGTEMGVTAMQMDIKIKGIPMDVMRKALNQAREARLFILKKMLEAIPEPRKELSKYAPKIVQLTIPQDKIGELIGPGGKIIKNIIAVTGAQVDVSEDAEKKVGLVNISSDDQEAIDKAEKWISGMMRTVEPDEEFDGIVTRVESFGVFVEFLPGREGLVHVSRMGTEYIGDAHDKFKVGDTAHVRLTEVDDQGRYNLTMLSKEQEAQKAQEAASRPPREGGDRGGRGGDRGGFRGGDRGPRRFGPSSGGGDRGGRGGGYRGQQSY
jgi:polyribonucleotide nucleotidyltransferase